MDRDSTPELPKRDAFQPFYDYLEAIGHAYGEPAEAPRATLLHAEKYAQRIFFAVQRQVARIRAADIADLPEATQATMDAQFLITGLWLLRCVAIPAAAQERPVGGPIAAAVALFDAQLPDLANLHQAILDLDEPRRMDANNRRLRPSSDLHQRAHVEAISYSDYQWAGGTVNFDAALTASGLLTLEIRTALLRSPEHP